MTQKIGECKLCLQVKPLAKSHIIPKSFYEIGNVLLSDKFYYPKRRPVGVYDTAILCNDCETYLNKEYENDAKIILLDKLPDKVERVEINNPENINELKVFYQLKDKKEYDKIDRFFISVLWRASVSSIEDFKNTKLGCYEEIARQTIIDKSFNFADFFTIVLLEFSDLKKRICILPNRIRIKGVNFYVLTMGSIKVFIKCDKRKCPNFIYSDILMYKSALRENQNEYLLFKKYANLEAQMSLG